MRYLSSLWVVLMLGFVTPTHAQLIFQRDTIRIHMQDIESFAADEKATEETKESESNDEDGTDIKVDIPAETPTLTFNTQIRSEEALELPSLDSLLTMTETDALMIVLQYAGEIDLPSYENPTPVDVLFVSEQGNITRIYPSIVLRDINYGLRGKGATKAFVLLKAGVVEASGIRPGDVVEHPTFTPPPTMLE